ncbi:uncharacterized protein LOC133306502 [Gastrolobium bilobum]|uniref:uncharacterized protein LOC133306502 n=1 Tax=Gastrolobium bilobum TaxID=150636 RepID=UPI002AB21217|nr:uncharacterized protein LOC133306502 [Gastrolobium bilobum]
MSSSYGIGAGILGKGIPSRGTTFKRGAYRGMNRGRGRARGGGKDYFPSSQSTMTHPNLSCSKFYIPTHESLVSSTHAYQVSPSLHPTNGGDSSATAPTHTLGLELPRWGSIDVDGKMWILPESGGKAFDPASAMHDIASIILHNYSGAWKTYSQVPEDVKKEWYRQFQEKHKCLPQDEDQMRKSFHEKASNLLTCDMHRLRNDLGKQDWIDRKNSAQLHEKWDFPNWQMKTQRNKDNRACYDGPTHMGGSIPKIEYEKRRREDLESDPKSLCWEKNKRTQTFKSDCSSWISTNARANVEEFMKQKSDQDNAIENGEDLVTRQSDNQFYVQAAGGMNRKGRINNLGSEAGRYKASKISTNSCEGVSASEYDRIRELITNLVTKNEQLTMEQQETRKCIQTYNDRMHTQEQEMIIMKEQLAQLMAQVVAGMHTPTCSSSVKPTPKLEEQIKNCDDVDNHDECEYLAEDSQ